MLRLETGYVCLMKRLGAQIARFVVLHCKILDSETRMEFWGMVKSKVGYLL